MLTRNGFWKSLQSTDWQAKEFPVIPPLAHAAGCDFAVSSLFFELNPFNILRVLVRVRPL
jgi:hypothetical protein